MRYFVLVTLVVALGLGHVAHADEATPALRRYALIISSNDGGPDRLKLRYADSDARSIADVLQQLGGLRGDDLILVPNATRNGVERAFETLRRRLVSAKAGPRREVIIYYSGHSDGEGLLLAGQRIGYRELRTLIQDTGADVRIAILDSCASGALIRQRGGTRAASFLGDRSVDARGHAFLTASSADEAAQESDRIGAAFFTHYLVTGLRGAADISRDGIVTLGEAYQFAYHETLRRTEQTSGGAQHAAYDIQLAGIGDLVLTDLRSTNASLQLDTDIAGRVYIRNASGRLVAELQKYANTTTSLALAPGMYSVLVESVGKRRAASVDLAAKRVARVGTAQLGVATIQPATARGASTPSEDPERAGTFLDAPSWRKLGGYGGIGMRYSRVGARDGFNPIIEFAILYRLLSVGIVGGAVATASDRDGRSLKIGYGGVVGRYHILFGPSPFYLSVGAIAAAGGVDEEIENIAHTSVDPEHTAAWFFEPQLSGHLNVTRWLRFGLDVGYRVISTSDIDSRDLRGLTFGFQSQLGWF